uniref:Uncharacterized protein n=1 Tax=Timema poppense TaxID=170557 RepID=A0A7R9CGH3_TIMPO|nr:unnamed protein product [Timema poppensis]
MSACVMEISTAVVELFFAEFPRLFCACAVLLICLSLCGQLLMVTAGFEVLASSLCGTWGFGLVESTSGSLRCHPARARR